MINLGNFHSKEATFLLPGRDSNEKENIETHKENVGEPFLGITDSRDVYSKLQCRHE